MKNTITVTRKGQTTLPAELRHKLGLSLTGGILSVDYDEARNIVLITRPMTIEELSNRATSYIRPGTKPVRNVREYIERHRKADREGYTDE